MRQLAPDLWVAERPFGVPGMQLGVRMTAVRLADGGVWLHSPVELDAALRKEVEALGPVRAIVAPNKVHHLYVEGAQRAFPQARSFAAAGLPEKRDDLAFDEVLTETAPALWAEQIDQLAYEGAPHMGEVVFFHRASRSLIATDVVFRMCQGGLLLRGYLALTRSFGRLSQTGIIRLVTRDRAAARASRDRILSWDFDRVIMSHGEVLETGGHAAFREALAWL